MCYYKNKVCIDQNPSDKLIAEFSLFKCLNCSVWYYKYIYNRLLNKNFYKKES